MGSPDAFLYGQMRQKRNGLYSLAKPHLIGQNSIHAPVV